jgi:RNA polymerase primary sigma factor
MVELINQWRHSFSELETKLGRAPELDEIASEMKLPHRKAKLVGEIVSTVDAGFYGDSVDEHQGGLSDTLPDEKNTSPEDALVNYEQLAKAVHLLEEIDPREADVLRLRFGLNGEDPLTLKEIGEKLGLTRERVRQIQRIALTKLSDFMNAE